LLGRFAEELKSTRSITMGEFSIWHILLLLFVILIFFGPSRLPGLGNSLGKAIRGFKEGIKGLDSEINERDAQASRDQLPGDQQKTTEPDKTKNSSNT
jgi:TatA/E family protein of Tat protein translocase